MTTQPILPQSKKPTGLRRQMMQRAVIELVSQAEPALDGPQPGHVRGRGGQPADHSVVDPGPVRPGRSTGLIHRRSGPLAVVHRAVRQLLRGVSRRPRQGSSRSAAPYTQRDAGQKTAPAAPRGGVRHGLVHRAAPGRRLPGRGRRQHSRRRRGDRRHRLGGRKRCHRRERSRDPRVRAAIAAP